MKMIHPSNPRCETHPYETLSPLSHTIPMWQCRARIVTALQRGAQFPFHVYRQLGRYSTVSVSACARLGIVLHFRLTCCKILALSPRGALVVHPAPTIATHSQTRAGSTSRTERAALTAMVYTCSHTISIPRLALTMSMAYLTHLPLLPPVSLNPTPPPGMAPQALPIQATSPLLTPSHPIARTRLHQTGHLVRFQLTHPEGLHPGGFRCAPPTVVIR
jgi:hypothetical protein